MKSAGRSEPGLISVLVHIGLTICTVIFLEQLNTIVRRDFDQQKPIAFNILMAFTSGILTVGIIRRNNKVVAVWSFASTILYISLRVAYRLLIAVFYGSTVSILLLILLLLLAGASILAYVIWRILVPRMHIDGNSDLEDEL